MSNSAHPLSGYRVIELCDRPPAAFCTRQFAIWGADVAIVERDEGSPLRKLRPRRADAPAGQGSHLWTYLAANKRSVGAVAAATFSGLLACTDVLVTDWDEHALASLGASLDDLRAHHPHLVVVSITPCGLSGPYAGFKGSDIVTQALSGYMTLNGSPGLPPLRAPGRIAPYAIGANAFGGALAALWKREQTGAGELVEISEMESLAAISPFLRVQYLGGGDRSRQGGPEAGVRLYPCSDGWVSFHPYAPADKARALQAFGLSEADLPEDLLIGPPSEVVRKVVEFFSRYTRQHTMREVFDALENQNVVCGMLASPHELLSHEQLLARGFYTPLAQAGGAPIAFPGPGVELTESRPVEPAAEAVVAPSSLGWTPRAGGQAAPTADPPLKGVVVADFTQAWIGPFATQLLGDLGADVIKIESHLRPDIWRPASPNPAPGVVLGGHPFNRSSNFNSINRNKLDLTLDLRAPEARALCLKLIAKADIVADNYTPHVMEKFGLDYASLKTVKPDVISVSGSGFGKTGPWADYKSNGSAIEALGGWDFAHRYPGGDPLLMSFYQPDAICGFHMAAMMLMSLLQRRRTGSGECVDLSMLELAAAHIGETLLQAQFEPQGEPPSANRDPDAAPSGAFPCAGEDRWIAITVPDDQAWAALKTLARFPGALQGPEFDTLEGRRRNEDRLEALLAAWTATWEGPTLMETLQAQGIPAGVVLKWIEAFDDPHLVARGWFLRMEHPDTGVHAYNGFTWRFAGCELKARNPPPRLGEHSDQVLRERLGLDEAEIADLKARDLTGLVV